MKKRNVLERLRRQSHFTAAQVAEYLSLGEEDYSLYERGGEELPHNLLEALADLYHVSEYDILTGTAESQTVTLSPKNEVELIPFFKIVRAEMKMTRLLKEAKDGQRP